MDDQKILMFVADEYEDIELYYTKYRLLEAGRQVVIAGADKNAVYKGKHGYPCKPDISFEGIKVYDFTALVIVGGHAPDKLRQNASVMDITRQFDNQGKLIAFMCHGGSILISAKVLKGVKCTSNPSIMDDMINAGAKWVNESVVIDWHFISSRSKDDLPKFCPAIIDYLDNVN